jgi:hypothetical protein
MQCLDSENSEIFMHPLRAAFDVSDDHAELLSKSYGFRSGAKGCLCN